MQLEKPRKHKNWKENGSWSKNCIAGKINMGYCLDYHGYHPSMCIMYPERQWKHWEKLLVNKSLRSWLGAPQNALQLLACTVFHPNFSYQYLLVKELKVEKTRRFSL